MQRLRDVGGVLMLLACAGCPQAAGGEAVAAGTAGTGDVAPHTPSSASASSSPNPAATNATCDPACKDIEHCNAGQCQPACPAGEVYVPATGPEGFTMSRGMHLDDPLREDHPHRVVLTKPFCMDATEVTVAAYKECVVAGSCEAPRLWGLWRNYPTMDDHPVNKVHWRQAVSYCEHRHKTLPTEAQWEWAAGGGDGRMWAWGDEPPSCELTDFTPGILRRPSSDDGCHGGGTSPVASHPKGDRVWPTGRIHDLTGNVWEWCLDNHRPLWVAVDETDPLHLPTPDATHVVRGGGWNRSGRGCQVHYRGAAVVNYQVPGLGFRCVRNPGGAAANRLVPSQPSVAPAAFNRAQPSASNGPSTAAAFGSTSALKRSSRSKRVRNSGP
jgi:formylglycine-generating enzyme required for sulfatase activity